MRKTPDSSLFTKQEIAVAALVILGVLAYRVFFKSSGEDIPVRPAPPNTVTTTTLAPAPPGASAAPAAKEAPAETAYVPEDPKVRKGLCGFDPRKPLLHWRLVRLMQFKNPKLIVLPRYHGLCLLGKTEFEVVDYDFTSDLPFMSLGDFQMKAELVRDYADLQTFMDVYSGRIKEFGFQKPEGLIRWMTELGPTQTEMVVLSVRGRGTFRIRDPIGAVSVYPGVRKVGLNEVNSELAKDLKIQIVSFSRRKDLFPGKNVIAIDPLAMSSVQSPSVADEYWRKNRERLRLDFNSRFLVVSDSQTDEFPFVWGSALKGLGAGEVMVFITSDKPAPTPSDFPGVETIAMKRLAELAGTATILDTRGATAFRQSVRIQKTVPVPMEIRHLAGLGGDPLNEIQQQLQAGRLDPKYDLASRARYQQALGGIKTKEVVVIGKDDYDWMPLLLANHLKSKSQFRIYWYRQGFEALEIYKRVGQDMGDFRQQVKPIRSVKKEVKSVSSPDGKEVSKVKILRPRNGPKAPKRNQPKSPPAMPAANPAPAVSPAGN